MDYSIFMDNLNQALDSEISKQKQSDNNFSKLNNGQTLNGNSNLIRLKSSDYIDIPDDSPIRVKLGSGEVQGTLICKVDNNVLIRVNDEIYKDIKSCEISNDASKVTEMLQERLNYGLSINDAIARSLIVDGPSLVNSNSIVTGQKAVLNRVNSSADKATLVIGPPGTGKTYTMATLAIQLLKQGKKVLVVSNANIAVDNIILKIRELMSPSNSDIKNGKLIRFGNTSDESLTTDKEINSYTRTISKNARVYSEYKTAKSNASNIQQKIKQLTEAYNNSTGVYKDDIGQQLDAHYVKLIDANKKITDCLKEIRQEELKIVDNASILGTTIAQICMNKIFENYLADVVIVDEVSMCNLAQVIATSTFASDHLLMVGDPLQLSPIVIDNSADASILSTDIFEYLGIFDKGNILNHDWLVMLDEQRRMCSDISYFSRKYVYKGLLKDHVSTQSIDGTLKAKEPYSGNSLVFINTDGLNSVASRISAGSRYNILSAFISVSQAIHCMENGLSVCIITPYKAQAALINNIINQKRLADKVYCATIHQFQGHEADAIILDTVECEPFNKVSQLLKDRNTALRLINVAITRARGKLIAVGSKNFWFRNSVNIIGKFISFIENKGYNLGENEVTSILKLYLDNVYEKIQDCGVLLTNDLTSANSKITANIRNKDTYNGMIKYAMEQTKVRTVLKAKDITGLESLKNTITVYESSKADNIICVDSRVTYYGVTDEDSKVNLIIRIEDDIFPKLIEVGSHKVKKVKQGHLSGATLGLQKYISLHRHCNKCRGAMSLVLTRNNKIIVRCSSCRSVEFLTQEEINEYIRLNNVICTEHKQPIKGLKTKYGICAKCNAGHFLTTEQLYEL